ncbi:hypothetical protein RvY_14290 [Ramazzottius varieornatus]|uniref:Uncharacterized protein n=1 Tax=Ramazzottius varieornatus TaxID=947166 RepID=A0A1D1VSR2_RAMVA|nr:hypothetical protein RvY_14290 [Ramazzottius varieornatus]
MDFLRSDDTDKFDVVVNSCGPLVHFFYNFGKIYLIHRRCSLVPEAEWRGVNVRDDARRSSSLSKMAEQVKGPFVLIRDQPARSPSSYSSISGNGNGNGNGNGHGDSQSESGAVVHSQSLPPTQTNGNGVAWIFSELELAVEANPPFIIIDSAYADEISKNVHRGNLCRFFAITGSLASAVMAFNTRTIPASVPLLGMSIVTGCFYGALYMKDPTLRYKVLGKKLKTNGFQLNPDHFFYSDQQGPLILKAANSRFQKTLRMVPVILPFATVGVLIWRITKALS